jgi:hypothetical protein
LAAGDDALAAREANVLERHKTAELQGKAGNVSTRRFAAAPLLGWTDPHGRLFHRLLTRRALV